MNDTLNNNDFVFEPLTRDNFHLMHKLFCNVFNPNTSLSFLQAKYDTGYLGKNYLGLSLLALDKANGEAVGFCGVIPFKFKVNGEEMIGGHSCDHMVMKRARGNNLLIRLSNKCDDLSAKNGITFIYGFPNQNNGPILIEKCNWIITHSMQVFEIPVVTVPYYKLKNINKTADSFYDKIKSRLLAKFTNRGKRISTNHNGILHDSSFYNYKCFSDNHHLSLKYGKAWVKLGNALIIGNLEVFDPNNFQKLIGEIKRLAVWLGLRSIIFMGSKGLTITGLFENHYKGIEGNRVGFKMVGENSDIEINEMFFTYGDYDSY